MSKEKALKLTKDDALKLAIEFLGSIEVDCLGYEVIKACKNALRQPKEWQGLSDDEINKIYGEMQDNCVKDFPSELYAAWFKALKEKNNAM